MGRKLDLSGLTQEEADHVLQVVQRDMSLRQREEARLSEMKQKLDEEVSRCSLLSRQHRFNERCCIRCCSPFTFLLNPRRPCLDCRYNVCKGCCSYSQGDRGWICSACQKSRLLKTQSLEWFYSNVKRRFKRFGSAKVLRTLYRKHLVQHGALPELTEGSTYEESTCNEGSVYESDSTFYRQSEEHSMAETINVALRVAEEAIDEAITKAEGQTENQEKQKERPSIYEENRGELVEELATTIVPKIIRRRRELSDMRPEYNPDWLAQRENEPSSPGCPTNQPQSAFPSHASLKTSLWRSQSAFSLPTDDMLDQNGTAQQRASLSPDSAQRLKKEGTVLPSWKSVDRLDNCSPSSMLKSPDGNWIALQSTLLSRPSLLIKRKSLVFSMLERESGVVSAYDGMGSDTEAEGAALLEFRRKMTSGQNQTNPQPQDNQSMPAYTIPDHFDSANTLELSMQTSESSTAQSGQDAPRLKSHKPLLHLVKRKIALEHRRGSSSRRPSVMDINFNPEGAESSEDGLEDSRVRRSRRRRRSKKEESASTASLLESSGKLLDALERRRDIRQETPLLSDQVMDAETTDTATPDILSSGFVTPDALDSKDNPLGEDIHSAHGVIGSLDQKLVSKLQELASQVSEAQLSSTEDELDKVEKNQAEKDDSKTKEMEREEMRGEATWDMEVDLNGESSGESEDQEEEQMEAVRAIAMEIMDEGFGIVLQGEKTQVSPAGGVLDHMGVLDVDHWMMESDGEKNRQEEKGNVYDELCNNTYNETKERHDKITSEYETEEPYEGETRLGTEKGPELLQSEVDSKEEMEPKRGAENIEDLVILIKTERSTEHTDSEKYLEETTDVLKKNHTDNVETLTRTLGFTEQESQNKLEKSEDTGIERQDQTERRLIHSENEESFEKTERRMEDTPGKPHTDIVAPEEEEMQFEGTIDNIVKVLNDIAGELDEDTDEKRHVHIHTTQERSADVSVEGEGEVEIVAQAKVEESDVEQETARRSETEPSKMLDWGHEVESESGQPHFQGENEGEKIGEGAPKTEDLTADEESAPSVPEEYLSPEEIYRNGFNLDIGSNLHLISTLLHRKYTAVSLRSLTTEVLKVLNATEDLIQGTMGDGESQSEHRDGSNIPLSPAESKRLDEQLSKLEENVYVAAGSVYGLEAELGELEACARSISSATTDMELAHLEEQVASAAAQVQQSELQVSDIAARIAALKNAGLNVAPQTRFAKIKVKSKPETIDSSRQQRRRLPAPPKKDKEAY
ncbi:LOW QUALITY PROTEIN: rab effector MyRIP [Chanos chanos]|uniref:LOW QUALITY PROTEIN: rab effector MyRIP n=1 Tax=Chanos chanos TaxID=29144 RepID=A0A6J2VF58_CHACN|nr:LOW QUALITY PROTEIN: rab effector MyRIP-like [Chanos chanos]